MFRFNPKVVVFAKNISGDAKPAEVKPSMSLADVQTLGAELSKECEEVTKLEDISQEKLREVESELKRVRGERDKAWSETNQVEKKRYELEQRLKEKVIRKMTIWGYSGDEKIPSECKTIWTNLRELVELINPTFMDYQMSDEPQLNHGRTIIGELNLLEPNRVKIIFPKSHQSVGSAYHSSADFIKNEFNVALNDIKGEQANAPFGAKYCILSEMQLTEAVQKFKSIPSLRFRS